jgi:hypothetical protein
MQEFPNSADEIRESARTLIQFLRENIKDTHDRQGSSYRNFRLLQEFSERYGAMSYPSDNEKEFLWDFVAYMAARGILLAAESEWSTVLTEVDYDFEKLLYVRSPLKLFLCRIRTEEEAEARRSRLSDVARTTCSEFSPSEVFSLYCVWWADNEVNNRDRAYSLQIPGEPIHVQMGSAEFKSAIS